MVEIDSEMKRYCILVILMATVFSVSCEKRPEGGSYPGGGSLVNPPDPGDIPESEELKIKAKELIKKYNISI